LIPRATYRLQFNADFTFADAQAIVPYLADLGISHVYASPILTARRGSTHGYDVVDPTAINPELGGEDGLRRLVTVLHAHGLGLVVDIVPNHMGVGGADNPWWLDVLRHGQGSAYAGFFDIDWQPIDPDLQGKLLAPFLGKSYGQALADGDITLAFDTAADISPDVTHSGTTHAGTTHGWAARYFHHVFPIRPEDATLLDRDRSGALARHDPATPAGREALHQLLERQHYRLAWWRTAGDLINWRRFFDVTELASLRAEIPDVFDATHAVVLRLYAEGLIDGVRVDHVDGLADPGAYCRRLRAELHARENQRPAARRGTAWLVVEKILAHGEALDPAWQTDGTTGYDFMNEVSLVLHDRHGSAVLAADWARRTGRPAAFAVEERQARGEMLERAFSAQVDSAVDALHRIAGADVMDRDRTRAALRRCLVQILTRFPRYRTYATALDPASAGMEALHQAIEAARPACLPGDRTHLDKLTAWLGPIGPAAPDADPRRLATRRFEQLSAPVAAKSVEDTAFYRYGALLSRNDVGFDPGEGGGSVADWHAACAARSAWPAALLATATHDHKRGEDVRARLAVLSELPGEWTARLDQWLPAIAEGDAPGMPSATEQAASVDPGDRIMLLQMIVGAWPLDLRPDDATGLQAFRDRLAGWQGKALREAKLRSSWDVPDTDYEAAAAALLDAILTGPALADIRAEIAAFVALLMPAALCNSLAQTVLRLCAPGVPDIYQGTELLDLSLVDPDNRRSIDYVQRARLLALETAPTKGPDALKQRIIAKLLHFRREAPALFREGSYRPLKVTGKASDHIIAFARLHDESALVALCPRHIAGVVSDNLRLLPGALSATHIELPAGYTWRNRLSARQVATDAKGMRATDAFHDLPVAVLHGNKA
jgi:malto-oligosyltrehalose synthase